MIVRLDRVIRIAPFHTVGSEIHGRTWMVHFLPVNSSTEQMTLMRAMDVQRLFEDGEGSTDG